MVKKQPKPAQRTARYRRPGAKGFRGPLSGRASWVEPAPEYRGTTWQVCGLWPFAAGSSVPMTGVPLGTDLNSQSTVCSDPINWFRPAGVLHHPSMFVASTPGMGKSTLCRRMVTGLAAQGVRPLILGDLKPDYVDLVRALGGQVVRLGDGIGSLNPLDVGALGDIEHRLPRQAAGQVASKVHQRRLSMTASLIGIRRGQPITDHERTILSKAVHVLDAAERAGDVKQPVLSDLAQVLKEGPDEVREVTLDRGDDQYYRELVNPLHRSLLGLLSDSFGDAFGRPTTTRLDTDAPAVCIDISPAQHADDAFQAAVLLTCWSDGFAAQEAAHILADHGLEPQRHYFIVMDELWKVLRAGAGMVGRIDELTRTDRTKGLGTAMITHTLADLEALPLEEDRMKARGFVERAGMHVFGGLPRRELNDIGQVVDLSDVERDMVARWSTPASVSADGSLMPPPGQGKFLIKVGQRPGIPLEVKTTDTETASQVHNTNQKWENR